MSKVKIPKAQRRIFFGLRRRRSHLSFRVRGGKTRRMT